MVTGEAQQLYNFSVSIHVMIEGFMLYGIWLENWLLPFLGLGHH